MYAALLAALLAAGAPLGIPAGMIPTDVYVAPSGSDATGTGAQGRPWATASKAFAAIQAQRSAANAFTTYTVHLASGTYQNTALKLGAADSYTRLVSDGGPGLARLIGGYFLDTSTCAVYSGSIYRCPIGTDAPQAIIEDGTVATLARTPNKVSDPGFPESMGQGFYALDSGSGSHTVLKYSTGDFDPAGWTINPYLSIAAAQADTTAIPDWFWGMTPITSIDTTAHTLTTTEFARYYFFVGGSGDRYFVQGDLTMLNAAREWWVDTTASPHQLYYWPSNGTISGHEIIIPNTPDTVRIDGAASLTIDGVSVEGGDWTGPFWRYGEAWGKDYPTSPCISTGPDWYAPPGHTYCLYSITTMLPAQRHGAIYLQNTGNVTIQRSRIHGTGASGVYGYLRNVNLTFANDCFEQNGYDGLQLEGGYPTEGNVLHHVTVTNSVFDRPGRILPHGRGIDLLSVSDSTFARIEIGDTLREGIIALANCSSTAVADCYTTRNSYSGLWIHDAMRDSHDGGGLYLASLIGSGTPPSPVNTFDQVFVENVNPNPSGRAVASSVPAYYFDINSAGTVISNAMTRNSTYKNLTHSPITTSNVNWTGTFDQAAMNFAAIGVDRGTFPYPSCGSTLVPP